MRVLATTHPASGHLHLLVPILRGLSARGHEILVATSRLFCPAVEAVGWRAVAVGHDWLESEAGTTLHPSSRWGSCFQKWCKGITNRCGMWALTCWLRIWPRGAARSCVVGDLLPGARDAG